MTEEQATKSGEEVNCATSITPQFLLQPQQILFQNR